MQLSYFRSAAHQQAVSSALRRGGLTIDAPVAERLRVDILVSQRRWIPGTRRRAGVRVDPQLQAQRVDLRRSAADAVREPRGVVLETSGLDVAVGERPAVVDVDVLVAGGVQA